VQGSRPGGFMRRAFQLLQPIVFSTFSFSIRSNVLIYPIQQRRKSMKTRNPISNPSTPIETAHNPLPQKEVLDCEHVAAWLGVPVTTVRFWARLRRLPAVRIGKLEVPPPRASRLVRTACRIPRARVSGHARVDNTQAMGHGARALPVATERGGR